MPTSTGTSRNASYRSFNGVLAQTSAISAAAMSRMPLAAPNRKKSAKNCAALARSFPSCIRINPCVPGTLRTRPMPRTRRSEEHTSELQQLMRNSYADFCLKKKKKNISKADLITDKIPKKYNSHKTLTNRKIYEPKTTD